MADAVGKLNEERWKADVKARLGATEEQLEEVEAVLEVLQRDIADLPAEVKKREGQSGAEVRRLIEAEIAAHPEWQKARETLRSVVKRVESLEEWRDRLRSQGPTTGFMGRHAGPAAGPQPGDTLDGWHLAELAGRGGMGRVFRATKAGDTKAVKVMSPELSGDPAFEARFKREMMALARLDPHPGLVSIEDFGKCGRFGCWYLVMPFVEGETLQARLERDGALGADAARELFAGLAGALASAHGRGVFHRDIKPANVILTADGRAVLVDFGVARVAGGSGGTGLSAYTALFAAPEQMRTGHADARSDVCSLAATLYYALKYDDPSARDPHRFKPDRVPQAFRPVLTAALANDPDDRPDGAVAFRNLLARPTLVVCANGSGQYREIADAVEVAQPGALVRVKPGVYRKTVVVDRDIEVAGDGPRSRIVLEVEFKPCVVLDSNAAVVRGLTISPIENEFSDPAVVACQGLLEDCDIRSCGRGVHVPDRTAPVIRRCRIYDIRGNGVTTHMCSGATIEECDIRDNDKTGVHCNENSNVIRGCRITGNKGYAVGVANGSRVTVEGCDLTGNEGGAWSIGKHDKVEQRNNEE